jgi:hypothetical protein
MRKGRSLEKLVAYLDRHFAANDLVKVESPKRLRDKSTGRLREHDVVLTITSGHHTILVAVECRDRNRPVGVAQLEGFAKKCQETGIGQGVIVSPVGFTKTAPAKARSLGIRCISLDQVNVLPWLLCENLELYQTTYVHIDFTIIPQNDFDKKPEHFTLETDRGENITVDMLRNNLITALNKQRDEIPLKRNVGTHVKHIKLVPKNLTIIDSETGRRERVRYINTVAQCKTEVTSIPFVLQEYGDPSGSGCIAQLATADLDLGFTSGKLVIAHKLETGGEIVFIPNDKKKPNKANAADAKKPPAD